MKVYVILLNWNNAADTLECISSLMKLNFSKFDIIVCDNESKREDFENLSSGVEVFRHSINSEFGPSNIILLPTGGNIGFAGGVNFGIKYAIEKADYNYVWILNNDTVVAEDSLAKLVNHANSKQAGICGSSLIYYGNRDKLQAMGGALYNPWNGRSKSIGAFKATTDIPIESDDVEKMMSYVIGASMLVSKQFIETVGLMREEYFLYSEEHDWAHRGVLLGQKLAYAPSSFVFHKHGATIGTDPSGGSSLSLYYIYRSKLLFTRSHYPHCIPSVVIMAIWQVAKFIFKRHPKKALAVAHGLYRGLFDKGIPA